MDRLLIVLLLGVLLAVVAGVRRRSIASLNATVPADVGTVPADLLGPSTTWLVFATRYCATCDPAVRMLQDAHPEAHVGKVMVEDRPELADRLRVRMAPTAIRTDAGGVVVQVIAGIEAIQAHTGRIGALEH